MTSSATTDSEFARDTERFRRELLAHCYRMLGSVDEAEDVVQETYLRAWRSYDQFEGRSSVRTWLYRIATNACLSALRHHGRRVLPAGLSGPASDPAQPLVAAGAEVAWLQPIPDALATAEAADPAIIVADRESLRLALVASLQYLPARQRAVLILRDVLAFPAAEVATMLATTVAAVKSMLQRARATLAEVAPSAEGTAVEPTDPQARELLALYMAAFERSDVTLLEKALRQDAALEMVGMATWFAGIATCLPFMATRDVLGVPGEWLMTPTVANGQPAAAAYRRDADGVHRAYGIGVLTVTDGGISRIVVFADPELVRRFGFPLVSRSSPSAG